ncbi:MAG: hypothetical protein IKF64_07640 [Eubacterium sp.]|nr:hypothetical protein [Eubacterium sp.]
MREFRKKQRLFKLVKNAVVIVTAILLFFLIGFEKAIYEGGAESVALALHYSAEVLVIASLALVLLYSSKYSKCDTFLTNVELELSDCGYYLTNRSEKTVDEYSRAIRDTLIENAFGIEENLELTELDFALRGTKRNEVFYLVKTDELDKNDVIAHLDSVVYDFTAVMMKRSGNAVLTFVCNKADDGAIELSKTITVMGRKEKVKIAIAIAELETSRVYFLGNSPTKCQQMIANYVMSSEVPIPDTLKGERLPYQDALEERMKSFDLNEYRRGNFFSH